MTYHERMSHRTNSLINLQAIAREAMLEEKFIPDSLAQVLNETNSIDENILAAQKHEQTVDLRSLLWSSIDNDDSRDLDQIEVAEQLENEAIRLRVGIADVDAFVPKNSATDFYAAQNTTSVYTGVQTFPLLPPRLSENLTSLIEGEDRLAIVVDFIVRRDGSVQLNQIYRALVRNHAKLNYDSIGDWLDGKGELPVNHAKLSEQLLLQDQAADRLRAVRERAGALEFGTIEAATAKRGDEIYELKIQQKNQARYLIENLMIASNVLIAQFLETQNFARLERVVRQPERWQRIVQLAQTFDERLPLIPNSQALAEFLDRRRAADPIHFPDLSLSIVKLIGAGDYAVIAPGAPSEEHFGLAVNGYTHSTAPNRRYADLVTQRLVKAAIANRSSPYQSEELEQIAARCNERQTAARKVERRMRKVVAAQALSHRLGERFEAIVTGASNKGVFVRLINPPAEGRVVANESALDVGDRVDVRLLETDASKGFVDFERI